MGSIIFTVFGILSPMTYYIFIILLAIGFFGVYVPWNEKKKGKGGQGPVPRTGAGKKTPARSMSWPKALGVVTLCVLIFAVGMTLCIACAVMGQQLMALVGAALCAFALWGMTRAGRDFRAGVRSRSRAATPAKNAGGQTIPSFRPDAPDHMHITGASLSPKERLEQLTVLKNAGLIDDGEYQEKRKEILREL